MHSLKETLKRDFQQAVMVPKQGVSHKENLSTFSGHSYKNPILQTSLFYSIIYRLFLTL